MAIVLERETEQKSVNEESAPKADPRTAIQRRLVLMEKTLKSSYLDELPIASGEIMPHGVVILRNALDGRVSEELVRTGTFYSALKRWFRFSVDDMEGFIHDAVSRAGGLSGSSRSSLELYNGLFLVHKRAYRWNLQDRAVGSWSFAKDDLEERARIVRDLERAKNG